MKRIYTILFFTLCLIVLALFPLDLFLAEIPAFAIYAALIAMLACAVLVFLRSGRRMRVTSALLAVIVTISALGGIWIDPYFNSVNFRRNSVQPTLPYDSVLPSDKAQADLDYMMKYVRKLHPALMDGLPERMQTRYDQVTAELADMETITVNELVQKAEYVLAVLDDAHTSARADYAEPLYLHRYYSWKQAGERIAAVNGITVKELLAQSRDKYSFEAESWQLEQMSGHLIRLDGLAYLDIPTDGAIIYALENEAGELRTENCTAQDYVTIEEYYRMNNAEQPQNTEESFVRYEIDEARSLAVMTLTSCRYNKEYIDCLQKMFSEIKERDIRHVAVDLRGNGGGNSLVADEFIRYLDVDSYHDVSCYQRLGFLITPKSAAHKENKRYEELLFDGDVYILTSAGSFSSAMLFPQYIADNDLGTIIGEPPGNLAAGYGDIGMFRTPNAGIRLSVSTKKFYRADKENTDEYVMPDIACDSEDVFERLYDLIG